jgi:hypothetical protein
MESKTKRSGVRPPLSARLTGYASDALMLLNTVVIAVATWLTPVMQAKEIKQTTRAYSTKS